MNKRLLSLAVTLAVSLGGGMAAHTAAAQSAAQSALGRAPSELASPSAAASAVGRWLYDPQGNTIGSVRGLADDGRTAIVMIGSYFQPGSYEARVPARALVIVDGRVTLRTETIEALNAHSSPQG